MDKNGGKTGQTDMRLRFKKGDLLAIGAVLLLAALVFAVFLPGKNRGAARAEIYQDGVLIKTLPLSADAEFTVSGEYTNVITVRGGKVAVTEADCPGEDCVLSGWTNTPGRSLVCLPNRVEVRVTADESEFDLVAG